VEESAPAATRIADILKEYAAAKARAAGAAADAVAPRVIELITQDRLAREFAELNQLGWMLWLLLTVLGGVYLFILDKPSFGLLSDYLVVFFWGIGVPTAADKLTPAGVVQTLRATTPKAS
jgi:hypothetical protein